jgi:CHASE2 domain-containing sensor protein
MESGELIGGILDRARRRFLRHTRRSSWAISVITVAVILLRHAALPDQFATSALDTVNRLRAPRESQRTHLVVIDDDDYEEQFRSVSPLDAERLGAVLAAIAKGGPEAIVVDIDTSDSRFAKMPVLNSGPPIVWGVSPRTLGGRITWKPPLGGAQRAVTDAFGIAALPSDADGRIRRYRRSFQIPGQPAVLSLPAAAALTVHAQVRGLDNDVYLAMLGSRLAFPRHNIKGLMAASSSWHEGHRPLQGRIVVLGGTFAAARDEYVTPIGPMAGVELIGQALENELTGTGVPASGKLALGILQVVAGFAIAFLFYQFSLRRALWASLVAIPFLSLAFSWIAFSTPALWLYFLPVQAGVLIQQLYSKAEEYKKLLGRSTNPEHESVG